MTFKNIITLTMAAAALMAATTAGAVPREESLQAYRPGIVATGQLSYQLETPQASSLTIPLINVGKNCIVTTGASWLEPTVTAAGIEVNVGPNTTMAARSATLTASVGGRHSVTYTVTQPGSTFTAEATDGMEYVKPTSYSCTDEQPGEGINRTLDEDYNTLYHSKYAGYVAGEEPVLTYNFARGTRLEEVHYYPRRSGGRNGDWGRVEVEAKFDRKGEWERVTEMDVDFGFSTETGIFRVPARLLDSKFYGIRFKIMTGKNEQNPDRNFASCSEMRFVSTAHSPAVVHDMALFADNLCTALKPSTSQTDIDNMQDPFLKNLAQGLLNGTYSAEGRVAESETVRDLDALGNSFNAAANKRYDRQQGATGITMTQGKYVIFVEGIPERMGSTELRVVGWKVPEPQTFYSESYVLRNGINVIERTSSWDGLAYVGNYDEEGYLNGTGSTIRTHFVAAPVNGILRPTMTNDEIRAILDKTTYPTIDLMGQRVHSVWEVEALKQYTDGQWVRFINTLDLIVMWEHRLLGLEKYDRIPVNKTMAYVNYNYYMYQTVMGVSFIYWAQNRTCSPDNIIYHDDDVLWGLSHEWGHQHQMAPYFCWTGMGEVSNNIFSAYNVTHMGYPVNDDNYRGRFPRDKWVKMAPRIFLDDNYDRTVAPPSASGENKTSNSDAVVLSLRDVKKWSKSPEQTFDYSPALIEFANSQEPIPALRSEDPTRAINCIEGCSSDAGEMVLAPWVMLQYYFGEKDVEGRKAEDYFPDLYPDFFEALRQCDGPDGSSVEKKGGADKYELLVSAFNNNKNGKRDVFRSSYPNSVWTTKNYLPADRTLSWDRNSAPAILNCIRKMSRLTKYNLFEYFQRWGVITVAAIEQGDYGIQHYALTPDMYEEFKADMKALEESGEIRPLPSSMVETISYSKYPTFDAPNIPNDRPINYNDL